MNTKCLCLIALAAALLAGCDSAVPSSRPGPYVKPGLIMVPVDQARYYGIGCRPDTTSDAPPPGYPITDARSVQTDAPVSAIQYNRYPDPARPDQLMHEAHVVYRRDSAPRWRLQPADASQQIIVGPSLSEGRGEIKPVVSQELDSYLREQRANLQRQQQAMGQITEGLHQLADQQQQLAKEMAKFRASEMRPGSAPGEHGEPLKNEKTSDETGRAP